MKISTTKKILLIALFWLLAWQAIYLSVGREIIVPSPYSALKSFLSLIASAAFYRDVAATVFRCAFGMLLSFVFGLGTALLSYRFSYVRSLLSLPVLVFKATPVMAIILFLLLCLTSGKVPVVVCFLMCYPIVYTNLLSGFDHINNQHLELSKLYRLGVADTMFFIYLPSVAPEISASLNLISGLSWKTVVAAEVLATPHFSMGYNLMNAKTYLETADLFAWTISIICFSMMFEKIIKQILKRYAPKPYAKSKVLARAKAKQVPSTVQPPEITVSGLEKSYPGAPVFTGFSASFPAGGTTAIMAPSGRGKTTLLRLISGLESCDGGQISGVAHTDVSYLFQESRLLPWLNVFDNMALVLKNRLPAAEIKAQVSKMLDHLELSPNAQNLPDQLSGGMKHRVAIGRAFLYPASVLLLDEPFKELDYELKTRLIANVWPIYTDKKTILLVTHSREDADNLSCKQISL